MSKATIHSGEAVTAIQFDPPALISSLLEKAGVPFDMPCGGRQSCKKCKIIVSGSISAPSPFEKRVLPPVELSCGTRFACVTAAMGDVSVFVAASSQDTIVTNGISPDIPLKPFGKKFGIAVDIGTTTVAMYLYNLRSGVLISSDSCRNPQSAFGADVVSRIEKALSGSLSMLSDAIRRCLSDMLKRICLSVAVDINDVDSAVIAGNTAMMYLLCARSPESIAYAPFKQDCFFGEFICGHSIGLPIRSIYLMRSISAYIGGDITAALTASSFAPQSHSGAPKILADIGTNGEIALLHSGRLLCCSAAAGPAFEGADIHCGMTAKVGAASSVRLQNDKFDYAVIGNCTPIGICGSGILSAAAVMLDCGIIDETGRILPGGHAFADAVFSFDGQAAFQLPDTDIIITQKDIRAVQLAKSAVSAGISSLLTHAGIAAPDISDFLLAGGFGSYIDIPCAVRIGLIPASIASHARCVGNAAGTGASMLLRNTDYIFMSEQIAKAAETIDLNADPSFFDTYINAMSF